MLFAFENTPHIRFSREGSIGRLPERTLVQVPASTMVTLYRAAVRCTNSLLF